MHSQARAFLQPTRANIHQYQFNNPIVLAVLAQNANVCLFVLQVNDANFHLCFALMGSLACHPYFDTGHLFNISENLCHSHLLPSVSRLEL